MADEKVSTSAEATVDKETTEAVAEAKEEVSTPAKATVDKETTEAVAETPAPVAVTADKKEEKIEVVEAEKKNVPAKFKDLIEQLDKMSVLDLSEFVKVLEDHYGVSAAAPAVMVGAAAPAAGGEAEAVEEKTSFDVVLATTGAQKIQVIKAVREIKPDLGLKEAKDLVDGAPKEILKGAKKEDADSAKAKLEAAGATVELK